MLSPRAHLSHPAPSRASLPRRLPSSALLRGSQVSVEECARNFKVQAERIGGLQERAGKFAGMLAAFCERLGWRDLEALIAKFQV